MSAGYSNSSDYSQFAGNSQGIGCYVALAMLMETVDGIYPEDPEETEEDNGQDKDLRGDVHKKICKMYFL